MCGRCGSWHNSGRRPGDCRPPARWRLRAGRAATAPSTNIATETLRRLEEEQREFRDFLDRLRMAKDKAEFDQFMAERRGGGTDQAAAAG